MSQRRIAPPAPLSNQTPFEPPPWYMLLISQSSITAPGALTITAAKVVARTLQFFRVTFGASISTQPVISRPLTTAPAVRMLRAPEGVRVTPAGTPVLVASGKPELGAATCSA